MGDVDIEHHPKKVGKAGRGQSEDMSYPADKIDENSGICYSLSSPGIITGFFLVH